MVEQSALLVEVRGLVQGVYFRAFTVENAHNLGLSGYVRNLPGGSVEVYAEGTRKNLEKLIDYLREGPPAAKVTDLKIQWSRPAGKYRDFHIKY
jgi:acylphosphatase